MSGAGDIDELISGIAAVDTTDTTDATDATSTDATSTSTDATSTSTDATSTDVSANVTSAPGEEYYLSNLAHIMFSKVIIDQMVAEITHVTKDPEIMVTLAKSMQTFDYIGATNIAMPGIAITDPETDETKHDISLRFSLKVQPIDYNISGLHYPKSFKRAVDRNIAYLLYGCTEYYTYFIKDPAHAEVIDQIEQVTGLDLSKLHIDEATNGIYFDRIKGKQINIEYAYYTNGDAATREDGSAATTVASADTGASS